MFNVVNVGRVRSLVRAIIEQAPAFAGQADILAQVPSVELGGGPITMLNLEVDRTLPAAPIPDGTLPGSCWAHEADGTPIGTLLVWTQSGYIAALEFGAVTDDGPTELPRPETLVTTI